MIWLTAAMVLGSSLGFALGMPFAGLAVGTAIGGLLAWLIGKRSDREQ